MKHDYTEENSSRLATVTTLFVMFHNLPATDEALNALTISVHFFLAEWYEKNGKKFVPAEEPIEDEAIRYAFANLAQMVAEVRDELKAEMSSR